jgi:kynurenine formamidase
VLPETDRVHVLQVIVYLPRRPENGDGTAYAGKHASEIVRARSGKLPIPGRAESELSRAMKITTFVTGCALALAVFLFGQKRQPAALPVTYHGIVDLTAADTAGTQSPELSATGGGNHADRTPTRLRDEATRIEAPAHYARSLWTVDQIPPERLVAKLAVLDVRARVKSNPGYEITVEDISRWEQAYGQIPQGAVVVAETGWNLEEQPLSARRTDAGRSPGYSEAAARFLVEGRNVLGLGIDAPRVDSGSSGDSAVGQYTLSHSVYHLENVASLERVPASGAVVMVAPMKLEGRTDGPVRVLALVK